MPQHAQHVQHAQHASICGSMTTTRNASETVTGCRTVRAVTRLFPKRIVHRIRVLQ